MENAAALTSPSPRLRSQVNINVQQQLEKLGVLQQNMAHFDGLSLGRKRLSQKGRLFKVLEGDLLLPSTILDHFSRKCHRDL